MSVLSGFFYCSWNKACFYLCFHIHRCALNAVSLIMWLLEPKHLEKDYPITTFFENKRFSRFFWNGTNKIQGSTMQYTTSCLSFFLSYDWKPGNKKRATCFATLLQNKDHCFQVKFKVWFEKTLSISWGYYSSKICKFA